MADEAGVDDELAEAADRHLVDDAHDILAELAAVLDDLAALVDAEGRLQGLEGRAPVEAVPLRRRLVAAIAEDVGLPEGIVDVLPLLARQMAVLDRRQHGADDQAVEVAAQLVPLRLLLLAVHGHHEGDAAAQELADRRNGLAGDGDTDIRTIETNLHLFSSSL